MEILTGAIPLVRGVANQFFVEFDRKEDLIQEGLLKLHLHFKKEPPPNDALRNEVFSKRIRAIVKNAMIDYVRKSVKSTRFFLDISTTDTELKSLPTQFFDIAVQRAIHELKKFLPDIDRKILNELINPSDEYCMFLRKRSAIQNINTKKLGMRFQPFENETLTIAGYLKLPEWKFGHCLRRIKKIVQEKKSHIF